MLLLLLLFVFVFVFVFVKLSPAKRSSPPLVPYRFKTMRKNYSSLVATRVVSSHSTYIDVEVDRELVRWYSDLPAQNQLEALELQRRVNEHASDIPMSVWVWCSRGSGGFRHVLWCGGLNMGLNLIFWVLNLLGLCFVDLVPTRF